MKKSPNACGNTPSEEGDGLMMGDWYWGTGFGWIGFFFMLLFWAIIIVGIILVVRAVSGQGRDRDTRGYEERPPATRRSSALEILEERYARGEIDRQEFLDRKKDLAD